MSLSSTTSIDKAFTDDSRIGRFPAWSVRLVVALVLSVVSILLLKPRFAADIEYDPKTNKCELKTRWKNVMYGSLVATAPFYFIIRRYI